MTALQGEWLVAYDFCKGNGMNLVTLRNKDDAESFITFCKQRLSDFPRGTNGSIQAYIGGLLVDKEWQWSQSGEKISFNLTWASHEPSQDSKSCLAIMPGSGGYSNADCFDVSYSFVCEEVNLYKLICDKGTCTTLEKN